METLSELGKQVKEKLPTSWHAITTHQFIELAKSDSLTKMLSVLTNVPVKRLRMLSKWELLTLRETLHFISIKDEHLNG